MSVDTAQPLAGASPPEVFKRWMKVVLVSLPPLPFGPVAVPTTFSRSQGIAPDATKAGSEDIWLVGANPHTSQLSLESCNVARSEPHYAGLWLRMWVMLFRSYSFVKVA